MEIRLSPGPFIISGCLVLLAWAGLSWLAGPRLVPPPWETLAALGAVLGEGRSWRDISLTLFRGASGLGLALSAALVCGLPAGRSPRVMSLLAPLVASLQACPPVLWISLLLVWLGQGNGVPLGVVFASVFPPLFANLAQGAASLDPGSLTWARLYRVGRAGCSKTSSGPGCGPISRPGSPTPWAPAGR